MDLMKNGLDSQQASIDTNKFVMSECRICQIPVSIHVNANPAKTTCSDEHAQELKEYDDN